MFWTWPLSDSGSAWSSVWIKLVAVPCEPEAFESERSRNGNAGGCASKNDGDELVAMLVVGVTTSEEGLDRDGWRP